MWFLTLLSQGAGTTYEGNITDNGWTKLPNGLIIQWGIVTTSTVSNNRTVTYPIPFPHKVLAVVPTPSTTLGYSFHISGASQGIYNITNSSFDWHYLDTLYAWRNDSSVYTYCAYWMAIGY